VLSRALFLALCYFPCSSNDIVYQITSCRVHIASETLYMNMNMNLNRIHQWSIENCLVINTEKSQALLVNPSILPSPIVSPFLLGSNDIAFVDKVKKLAIIFNQELTWHDQVAKFCSGVFFTQWRLWTFSHFTPVETRRKHLSSYHNFYTAT
jgi:hypothetical protein